MLLLPLTIGAALLALIVCVLCLARRAWQTISDWAFLGGIALFAAERLFSAASMASGTHADMWQRARVVALACLPALWLTFSLSYARGNARAFLFRWRWAIFAAIAVPLTLALGIFGDVLRSPEGADPAFRLTRPGIALYVTVLVGLVLILVNFERTFRAAVGTIRWRIKFVILGVGILFLARIYTASQILLFQSIGPSVEIVNSLGTIVGLLVVLIGSARASRVTNDVYPSLSALQGSVTLTLTGVYLLVVGMLARVVAYIGGDASFALTAFLILIALVALAVVFQSDRVRLSIRRSLSRNFQRPVYDYRSIWHQFTDATSSCVEQRDLCRAIVRVTADIFQALGVTIWLLNERRTSFELTASTSVAEAKAREFAPSEAETEEVVRFLSKHPDAIDIDEENDAWAVALQRWHPNDFPNGGHRLCVPMLRHDQLVGLIIIGDRVSGVSFPLQDSDLLKCIADQSAAKLLNIQLAERLVQTKELEAFQTMATFLVHDLKNAASTLNLMLKNMPVHFNDPAFREDALRGMGKTVSHINGLIARLGQLRSRLELHKAPADLNDVVRAVLDDFPASAEYVINTRFNSLAPVALDSEQMKKVVVNLLLNATEACQGHGEISVHTAKSNGSVILSVADNGCGMSAEFIRSGLFRPFQTTKKSGLGIGMFQSKMIIEAHGGNILVKSAPDHGTTFEIHLPISK